MTQHPPQLSVLMHAALRHSAYMQPNQPRLPNGYFPINPAPTLTSVWHQTQDRVYYYFHHSSRPLSRHVNSPLPLGINVKKKYVWQRPFPLSWLQQSSYPYCSPKLYLSILEEQCPYTNFAKESLKQKPYLLQNYLLTPANSDQDVHILFLTYRKKKPT